MDGEKLTAELLGGAIRAVSESASTMFTSFSGQLKTNFKLGYESYITSLYDRYSKGKSFFSRDQAIDFYDYYVSVGVKCGDNIIREPSYLHITPHHRLIISGLGGAGKTILLRHLLLGCILDGNKLPILVELRELNTFDGSLTDYILSKIKSSQYKWEWTDEMYEVALSKGHFVFFFDGYDEVRSDLRSSLNDEIRDLSRSSWSSCPVVITTRPDDQLHSIDEYQVYSTLPLSKDCAIQLVHNLDFFPDVKQSFLIELETELYDKHTSFLSNPLLLSIMLLTYSENANIPHKLSSFYEQAYEALFQRHDARKEGSYSRPRKTDLDMRDFAKVFALFCVQTYDKRLFSFSETECIEYLSKSSEVLQINFDPNDYLSDLKSATCLIVEDGLHLNFAHRSFQEYFVAKYICSSPSEIQRELLLRCIRYNRFDNVLNLVLELDHVVVERYLFLPALNNILEKYRVNKIFGITHALRYLKDTRKALYLHGLHGQLNVGFSYNNSGNTDSPSDWAVTAMLALDHAENTYSVIRDEMDKMKEDSTLSDVNDIIQTYLDLNGIELSENRDYIIHTEELTIKSELFKSLFEFSHPYFFFGKCHLNMLVRVKNILKEQEKNRTKGIMSLLGVKK